MRLRGEASGAGADIHGGPAREITKSEREKLEMRLLGGKMKEFFKQEQGI